jgi:6-phosphogluconate dehydrogenase
MKVGLVGLGRMGSNMVRLGFMGHVSHSCEGRWTLKAAINDGVPAPILTTALTQRFASRGDEDFANKLLSAMRYQFGGHEEKR